MWVAFHSVPFISIYWCCFVCRHRSESGGKQKSSMNFQSNFLAPLISYASPKMILRVIMIKWIVGCCISKFWSRYCFRWSCYGRSTASDMVLVVCKRSSLKFGAPRKYPFLCGRNGIFTGKIFLPVVAITFVCSKVSVAIKSDGDTRFGVKKFSTE